MKYISIALILFLYGCGNVPAQDEGGNNPSSQRKPIDINLQQAGYILSTATTSIKLASSVTSTCDQMGVKNALDIKKIWSVRNQPMIDAVDSMMKHKEPNPNDRAKLIVGMEQIAQRTSTKTLKKITDSPDPSGECLRVLNLIKSGAIDIGKEKFVNDVLKSYL